MPDENEIQPAASKGGPHDRGHRRRRHREQKNNGHYSKVNSVTKSKHNFTTTWWMSGGPLQPPQQSRPIQQDVATRPREVIGINDLQPIANVMFPVDRARMACGLARRSAVLDCHAPVVCRDGVPCSCDLPCWSGKLICQTVVVCRAGLPC